MRSERVRYLPAAILISGCLLLLRISGQRVMPLSASLSTLPAEILGYRGTNQSISPEEQRVAGMSSYVSRTFGDTGAVRFSVYVGYYDYQTQGRTIHSPKNCLPGSGWEPLNAREQGIKTAEGTVPVNQYVLANRQQRAVVLYWYQGRGRVAANEYRVKWELLRDAALKGRTEEALVRVVVPVTDTLGEAGAASLARAVAAELIPSVTRVLPS